MSVSFGYNYGVEQIDWHAFNTSYVKCYGRYSSSPSVGDGGDAGDGEFSTLFILMIRRFSLPRPSGSKVMKIPTFLKVEVSLPNLPDFI